MVLAEEETVETFQPPVEPWDEPTTIDTLLDRYVIEGKFAGRSPSTTLYLTLAQDRSGTTTQTTEKQRWKLFLASCRNHPKQLPSALGATNKSIV